MRTRTPGILIAIVLVLGLAAPVSAEAVNSLSQPMVTPSNGTTADTFVLSVRYTGFPPDWVQAMVGGEPLPLNPAPGEDPLDGIYQWAGTLPAGEHQVQFEAVVPQGNDPVVEGPTITVTEVVTASPSPTAPPTASPTTRPTASPRPPTPAPTAEPTLPPLAPTPFAPVPGTTSASPSASGLAQASEDASTPLASGFVGGVVGTPETGPTTEAAPGVTPVAERDGGGGVWTLLGGGLLGVTLLAVLAMVGLLRSRRAWPPPEPMPVIGPQPMWDADAPELVRTPTPETYEADDPPMDAAVDDPPTRS